MKFKTKDNTKKKKELYKYILRDTESNTVLAKSNDRKEIESVYKHTLQYLSKQDAKLLSVEEAKNGQLWEIVYEDNGVSLVPKAILTNPS